MTCPECTYQWVPAKSKRLVFCPNCRHLEVTGETLVDMKKRKAKEQAAAAQERAKLKAKASRKSHLIKQYSEKGKRQALQVTATKKLIREEHSDGEEFARCEGCHQYFRGLDASHKVSLARNSELAADPDNIRLLCRDCHLKWESSVAVDMIELKCLEEDLAYLLDFDPERFWKIFHRLLDEQSLRPTAKLGAIISRLEKLE